MKEDANAGNSTWRGDECSSEGDGCASVPSRLSGAEADPQSRQQLRWAIYAILIAISASMMFGRILAIDSVDKVAAESERTKKAAADFAAQRKALESSGIAPDLLAQKLEEIDGVEAERLRKIQLRRPFLSANDRSRWCTVRALVEKEMRVEGAPYAIDKVIQEPTWDTIDMVKHDGHLYSSKPPLLPTLMAGVYWPIHRFGGITLGTHPYEIGRFMLIVFNVVPMIFYFVLLAKLIERFGSTDWGRVFVMGAATFATFLTTFSVTINNHLPAAVCVAAATYAAVRILFDGERRLRYFVAAGLFAAMAVANELPAASFAGLLTIVLLWRAPRQTLSGFLPAALLIAVALFGTNWIAHGTWQLAYMHRTGEDNWYDYTYQRNGRTIGSYWQNPVGVDRGEPVWSRYATHILVGHHGIFSLTPVWLLSAAGAVLWLCRPIDPRLRWMAAMILALSLICVVFYLGQPPVNRNYGGVTSGLRWMFWFAPLWLVAMLPAVDATASRRWARGLAIVLLALSVISASYPTWNPWTPPWIMNYMQYMGWIS